MASDLNLSGLEPDVTLDIRTMDCASFDTAIDWAAAEGWNPGRHDRDCYLSADPAGFLMAYHDQEPVACISVVRYSEQFGFLGFYIVVPEHRGKGFGWQTWQAGMQYLSGCNVGLDGVVAQQDNYRKSGFSLAWRNIRFEGRTVDFTRSDRVTDLSGISVDQIFRYDRPFFPTSRPGFLQRWLTMADHRTLGYLDDQQLKGYLVIRPCQVGYKVGPLYADDDGIAEQLLGSAMAGVEPGAPIFLDCPEVNPAALRLAEQFNMRPSFETARMYTHQAPDLPLNRLYGVTCFEIG